MPEPNPEQTCSLFALAFYTYLDPVIMLGYRVPHVRFDQLPPLSDSDYSQHLTKKAFPVQIYFYFFGYTSNNNKKQLLIVSGSLQWR
jgi:hypothetical protein